MQAIIDNRTPNKNRLFMLDLDLQVQIFAYAGLFGDTDFFGNTDLFGKKSGCIYYEYHWNVDVDKEASKLLRLFETTRKEALYYDKLYFISKFSLMLWENLPNTHQMRCRWCDARIPICNLISPEYRDRDYEPEYDKRKIFCPSFEWRAGDPEYDPCEDPLKKYKVDLPGIECYRSYVLNERVQYRLEHPE
jgi:hypothetical protein